MPNEFVNDVPVLLRDWVTFGVRLYWERGLPGGMSLVEFYEQARERFDLHGAPWPDDLEADRREQYELNDLPLPEA